jgi:predicted DNA-binding transcriptional regulator AlpA
MHLITIAQTCELHGVSRATEWRLRRDGLLPPTIAFGPKRERHVLEEIQAIIAARVKGQSEAEIKLLVNELKEARHALAG